MHVRSSGFVSDRVLRVETIQWKFPLANMRVQTVDNAIGRPDLWRWWRVRAGSAIAGRADGNTRIGGGRSFAVALWQQQLV